MTSCRTDERREPFRLNSRSGLPTIFTGSKHVHSPSAVPLPASTTERSDLTSACTPCQGRPLVAPIERFRGNSPGNAGIPLDNPRDLQILSGASSSGRDRLHPPECLSFAGNPRVSSDGGTWRYPRCQRWVTSRHSDRKRKTTFPPGSLLGCPPVYSRSTPSQPRSGSGRVLARPSTMWPAQHPSYLWCNRRARYGSLLYTS